MKNLFTTLSVIILSMSLSLNAQSDKSTSSNEANQAGTPPTGVKARFINNQDYLSASSLKDYTSYYGDSLKGFDEVAIKADLLTKGVYGSEYINYIPRVKRDFINQKYNIGDHAFKTSIPLSTIPGQPSSNPGNSKNIGGGSSINIAPCVNEDFEATPAGNYSGATNSLAITGWTIQSGTNGTTIYSPNTSYGSACNANPVPSMLPGSSEIWMVQTPILGVPWIGTLPNSPLGGNKVVKMNDATANGNYRITRISSKFPVTVANTLFQFAYAGSWDGVHDCCGQPSFRIDMYQGPCSGPGTPTLMACSNISLTPSGNQCTSGVPGYTMTGQVSWTNWVVKYIDLTPYIGSCVTIVVTNSDCSYGGHHGSAYFDARCGGQLIGQGLGGIGGNIPGPVSFCAGSNQALIAAPLGYNTYTWVAPSMYPPIPISQATLSTLTVTNPIPGTTFTVILTGASGCQFMATNAIVFSTVNIAGIGSTSTCIGGASGSATVQGNGSGTGYNYTWINAGNSATVGTTAVVNGLAPGIYSIVLTGLGASGCGSAVATTTIAAQPSSVIDLLKPYCGSEAYLGTSGGTNFQWYNGLSIISPSLGGTAPGYTVTNPINLSVYWLSYTSQYGCRDSVKFTLAASPPGNINVSNISWICPGGSNGTAQVNMSPAGGAPPGINSFSVYSTGTTPPYTSSVFPTANNTYTVGGLAAGTYSVKAFDGSCKYGVAFNVAPFVYNYTLSPNPSTLCPGNSIAASVSFTSPPSQAQYTYSWTPNIHLAGNANTYSSTIISPNISVGTQTTITYSVIVTPSVVNCPITKTISITAVNPPIPTITAIPNLCNTSSAYQIVTNPPGGTFITGISGTNNPIGSTSGMLTPNVPGINIGVNTFTYSIAINTCIATKTATYEVSQFNTAALTSSVPPMCVTNAPFNLMTIVQSSVNGTWTGTGTQFGTTFNPGSPILNTGNYQINYNTTSSPNPTVCPASTPLFVSVTKTITPFITPVPEFCTSFGPITMTVNPPGGGWMGNAAVSNAGMITPTLAVVPNSSATYTVQIGPCLNSNTTQLSTSKFYPAGFSATLANMCESNPAFNLMSIVQSTANGVWSVPAPQPANCVISNSFIPTNLATSTYTLKYTTASSPNPTLCADTRTIAVSVLNPTMPSIADVGPLCSTGSVMQLTVSPTTGYWVATPYLNSAGVLTPSLASVGNNPVQYVVGTSTCNVQQTKFVSIEAFVPAKIVTGLPDQCNTGSPVSLSPFTLSGLGTWSGVGISGSTFNPALAGSGTYTLLHKTASTPSGLCPDEDMMSVNVYSLATPALTKIGPFCTSAHPTQIQVSPVGGYFSGSNIGIVSLAGEFNPSSASIGENVINYSITSGPCIAYAQTTISVEQFVSADFAKEIAPFCLVKGKVNPVNMNSYVQNPGGFWSSITSPKSLAGNMFDPFAANEGKNNVIIYQTHSMPTATLCPDTSAVRIEVREVPEVTALTNNTEPACLPAEIIFNSPSINVGEGTWNFDDGSESKTGFEVSHVYTKPGTYIATFSYKDDIGCEALPAITKAITVNDVPKADFTFPEEVYISNPEVQLTNLTTILGDNTYQWTVSNVAGIYNQVHPVVPFQKIGKYQITLIATTPNGCKDEITKSLEVKNDFNIYIPTSFSPNFDGLNDVFIPVFSEYGLDLKSFEMEIFDRWGHSLYRTKDATKGWDGSVANKGEPLKEEVYIYRIKYKDLDGNSYNKMGHVSLLK